MFVYIDIFLFPKIIVHWKKQQLILYVLKRKANNVMLKSHIGIMVFW